MPVQCVKMRVAGFSPERLLSVQIILEQMFRGKAVPIVFRHVFRHGLLTNRLDQPPPAGLAECAIKHPGSMAVMKKVADVGTSAQLLLKVEKIGNQVRAAERPDFQHDSWSFHQPLAYAPDRLFPTHRSTLLYRAGNFGDFLSHYAFPFSVILQAAGAWPLLPS